MHHFVNQFASAMLFCNIFFKYSQCIFFLAEDQKENVIRKAMRGIEAVSCIQFREYSSPPTSLPYLNILSSDGCWSYIGKNSGPGVGQELSLTIFSCTLPSIATHEFLHALGMFHEQSRIDRDQYVNIHTENIIKGKEQQFSSHNTNSLNSPYDPDSIMHYPRNAFSKNEKPTITWKIDPSRKLGGNVLTASDIYQLNAFYECPSMPKTTPSTTTIATTPSTTTTTTTTTTKKPTTTAKKTMTTTRRPTTTKSRKATTTASSSTTIATNPKTQVPPGRVECSFRNQKKISSIC
ncbi:zinc metalloproteinase nas-14-like isoform X2 [Hydractinia symbiolongicarpus]|uniref:zinc metalloproteinase nas-14-like isoform X2 n=1 Tax=Hydractinia symbiolongicarpus TaxID=13093 RepID=UPI00254DB828|nr:zinc metalloproteinase nas-14-like isoform X2 [Hydractinia symbiolongicarpus]